MTEPVDVERLVDSVMALPERLSVRAYHLPFIVEDTTFIEKGIRQLAAERDEWQKQFAQEAEAFQKLQAENAALRELVEGARNLFRECFASYDCDPAESDISELCECHSVGSSSNGRCWFHGAADWLTRARKVVDK